VNVSPFCCIESINSLSIDFYKLELLNKNILFSKFSIFSNIQKLYLLGNKYNYMGKLLIKPYDIVSFVDTIIINDFKFLDNNKFRRKFTLLYKYNLSKFKLYLYNKELE
jgi:hypothetical protein